jgi:hypothetical protein
VNRILVIMCGKWGCVFWWGLFVLKIFNYAVADPETWVRFPSLPGILRTRGSGRGYTRSR